MLILSLSLLSTTLAGGLSYSIFQGRKLRRERAGQTRELEWMKHQWGILNAQALRETGFATATEAISGYRRLCSALGDSLHNYDNHGPLSEERRSYLAALGNLLKALARSDNGWSEVVRPAGPQVMGWPADKHRATAAVALSWAPKELQPLLDGLTLRQVLGLTLGLLDATAPGDMTKIFNRMGLCLLTTDCKSQEMADNRAHEAWVAQWTAAFTQWKLDHPDAEAPAREAFATEYHLTHPYTGCHWQAAA